jgi:hypothetical protein
VTMQGTVYLETKDGAKLKLLKVKYSPDFEKQIISVGCLLDQGCLVTKMTATEIVILSQDKKRSITADRTSSSKLYYLLCRALEGQKQDQVFSNSKQKGHIYTLEEAHKLCGHANVATVKRTAVRAGWSLTTTTMPLCGACVLAKAQQKQVPKTASQKAEKPGEQLYVDLLGPYAKSIGGSTYWLLMVDKVSKYKWSMFLTQKSQIGQKVKPILQWLQLLKFTNKFIQSNNAGKNKKHFEKLAEEFSVLIGTHCTLHSSAKWSG